MVKKTSTAALSKLITEATIEALGTMEVIQKYFEIKGIKVLESNYNQM